MTDKQRVIDAIVQLGRTVAVADVAAKTGLPLHVANLQLNKVAFETQGVLQVAPSGNIIYKFAPEFRSAYAVSGIGRLVKDTLNIVKGIALYIVQISFGVLILASFLTLVVLFVIVLTIILVGGAEAEGGDGGELDADGFDLGFDFFDIGNLFMFFTWSRHDVTVPDTYLGKRTDIGDRGFLYNCFNFLFGDGNPNLNLEEKRWRHVANLIRSNDGVVTSEQLAPYTDGDPKNESNVLPALVRYEGFPEVTQTGNIVYVFPSLQISAARDRLFDLPAYLEEEHWHFTHLPMSRLHIVYFFAGANLAGWYCLWKNMWRYDWLDFLSPYTPFVYGMLAYAMFFLGFPIARQLINVVRNSMIDIRNKRRQQYKKLILTPAAQQKLLEARAFGQAMLRLRSEEIVYTTERDALEQQFD